MSQYTINHVTDNTLLQTSQGIVRTHMGWGGTILYKYVGGQFITNQNNAKLSQPTKNY